MNKSKFKSQAEIAVMVLVVVGIAAGLLYSGMQRPIGKFTLDEIGGPDECRTRFYTFDGEERSTCTCHRKGYAYAENGNIDLVDFQCFQPKMISAEIKTKSISTEEHIEIFPHDTQKIVVEFTTSDFEIAALEPKAKIKIYKDEKMVVIPLSLQLQKKVCDSSNCVYTYTYNIIPTNHADYAKPDYIWQLVFLQEFKIIETNCAPYQPVCWPLDIEIVGFRTPDPISRYLFGNVAPTYITDSVFFKFDYYCPEYDGSRQPITNNNVCTCSKDNIQGYLYDDGSCNGINESGIRIEYLNSTDEEQSIFNHNETLKCRLTLPKFGKPKFSTCKFYLIDNNNNETSNMSCSDGSDTYVIEVNTKELPLGNVWCGINYSIKAWNVTDYIDTEMKTNTTSPVTIKPCPDRRDPNSTQINNIQTPAFCQCNIDNTLGTYDAEGKCNVLPVNVNIQYTNGTDLKADGIFASDENIVIIADISPWGDSTAGAYLNVIQTKTTGETINRSKLCPSSKCSITINSAHTSPFDEFRVEVNISQFLFNGTDTFLWNYTIYPQSTANVSQCPRGSHFGNDGPPFGQALGLVEGCICDDGTGYMYPNGKCVNVSLDTIEFVNTTDLTKYEINLPEEMINQIVYLSGETPKLRLNFTLNNISFGDKLSLEGEVQLYNYNGKLINNEPRSCESNPCIVDGITTNYYGYNVFDFGLHFKTWNGTHFIDNILKVPYYAAYIVPIATVSVKVYGIPTLKNGSSSDMQIELPGANVFLLYPPGEALIICITNKTGECTFGYVLANISPMSTENPYYQIAVSHRFMKSNELKYLTDTGKADASDMENAKRFYFKANSNNTLDAKLDIMSCKEMQKSFVSILSEHAGNEKGEEIGLANLYNATDTFIMMINSDLTKLCKFKFILKNTPLSVASDCKGVLCVFLTAVKRVVNTFVVGIVRGIPVTIHATLRALDTISPDGNIYSIEQYIRRNTKWKGKIIAKQRKKIG